MREKSFIIFAMLPSLIACKVAHVRGQASVAQSRAKFTAAATPPRYSSIWLWRLSTTNNHLSRQTDHGLSICTSLMTMHMSSSATASHCKHETGSNVCFNIENMILAIISNRTMNYEIVQLQLVIHTVVVHMAGFLLVFFVLLVKQIKSNFNFSQCQYLQVLF